MNHNCPICHSEAIKTFLHREKAPVHQNLLINDQEAAAKVAYGKLDLVVCAGCLPGPLMKAIIHNRLNESSLKENAAHWPAAWLLKKP